MTLQAQKIKRVPTDTTFTYRVAFDNYYPQDFIINGDTVNIPSKCRMSFAELPTIQLCKTRNTLSHFENQSTGDVISIDDYTAVTTELLKYREDEDYWSDLDKEFEYKKYTRDIKSVYQPIIENEDVKLSVSGPYLLETNDPYITSDYFLNDVSLPLCKLNTHQFYIDTFVTLVEAEGLTKSESSGRTYYLPTHSGLRFAKINGAYVFGTKFETKVGAYFTGSLEQCVARKEIDKETIVQLVETHIRGLNNKLNLTATEIIVRLDNLANLLDSIQVKQSSTSEMITAKKVLRELKENL